ncbi:hypothetical protein B0T22DRAFT_173206 [Podospora appendiculata]|uniref:Uncharacterized protein n=1 Tax=Podospora appendiculata TaxID=314037 RepID=A0AAE0XBQ0_9PEZI|nr:hypothetical protein B0T22DRAFT_173206 [Podospora appendiculata]
MDSEPTPPPVAAAGPGQADMNMNRIPIDDILAAISTTSATITRFIRSVRAAHADLTSVTRELSEMRLTLDLIQEEQDIPTLLKSEVAGLLVACGDTLAETKRVLDQCHDAAQWTSTGRAEITGLRARLETFRRAFGLVLDVASLSSSSFSHSTSNSPETDATRTQINAEVEQLQTQVTLLEHNDGQTIPVLESYLTAVINCVQAIQRRSAPSSKREEDVAAKEIQNVAQPTDPGGPAIEDGLEVLNLGEHQPSHPHRYGHTESIPGYSVASSKQPYESAGPWYPSGNIVLPFYNAYPPPGFPIAQTRQPQPPRGYQSAAFAPEFQQSPPLRPQQIQQQSQIGQRTHSPMVGHPYWSNSASSPSTRSEPFDTRSHRPSPEFRSERWSEPAQGQNPGNAYTYPQAPYHTHRDASIGSITSFNSYATPPPPAPSDSPRSTLSAPRVPSSTEHRPSFASRSDSPRIPPSVMGSTHNSYDPTPSMAPRSESPTPSAGAQSWNQTPRPSFQWQRPPSPSATVTSQSVYNTNRTSTGSGSGSIASHYDPPPPPPPSRVEVVPLRHLTDPKGKPHDIFHIDSSPNAVYVATKHANNTIKIWNIAKNAVHATLKITSYVQPQARSREYFIRSHALLSESATLIGITTHFGFTLEIYNFAKPNSSGKKVQVIDEAHRWAASRRDSFQTNVAPLVVYRPKGDRIDRFFSARHPNAKKPFWEDASNAIELAKAGLPFIPKFPELVYSSNSPFLVAAAGPRPGDPPRANATILVAWQMTPVSEAKLAARSPVDSVRSFEDEERHKPYRFCVPNYPSLQNALPAVLAAHGSIAVSIWIPANHADVAMPGGKFRRTPVPAPERWVLVWDLPSNVTKVFGIPNVQACVSPDCRLVAYCDPARGRFVLVDVQTGEDVWRWPEVVRVNGFASFGQLENLGKVTVFEFSADGRMLVVGDASGGLGVYEVKEVAGRVQVVPQPPPPRQQDARSFRGLGVGMGMGMDGYDRGSMRTMSPGGWQPGYVSGINELPGGP